MTLILAVLGGLAAPAQDAGAWKEALAHYAKYARSREGIDRARAAEKLGKATAPEYDAQCWKLVSAILTSEVAREGRGGRTEEQVSGETLEACIGAFRRITDRSTIRTMVKVARSKRGPFRVRMHVVWGLSEAGVEKELLELLDDPVPQIQIAAAGALAEGPSSPSLPTFLRLLEEDRTWEVKAIALEALERAADDSVVDALIAGLGKVREEEGRLKDQYIRLLQKLVVEDLDSDDPNAWKAAWTAKKGGDEVPTDGRTITEPTEFYGLKTRSTRIVFVLDRTGSMEAPGSEPARTVLKVPPEASVDDRTDPREARAYAEARKIRARWDEVKVRTRMEAAKKELINTVFVLHPKVRFNVIWYEGSPQPWQEALVPATWQNKLDCLRAADKTAPSGSTNIWDGLEAALQIVPSRRRAGMLVLDRGVNYATAVGGADTFYLMTDGQPNEGRIPEPSRIIGELRKMNRLRRIVVHTICVGDFLAGVPRSSPRNPDPDFLRKIAEENGGEFTHLKQ